MGNQEVNNAEVNEYNYQSQEEMLKEFITAFKVRERFPNMNDKVDLCSKLIREEAKEVVQALQNYRDPLNDPEDMKKRKEELVKELCDLEYVMSKAVVLLDLSQYMGLAFTEVHFSNMSKLKADGTFDVDKKGKVLKSEHYVPADIGYVIYHVDVEND